MLNNIWKLFVADLVRLKKYNILQISLALAVLYGVILYFVDPLEAQVLAILLIFVDVTMMSIIMLGASLFFERQEGSLKSVMVAPISLKQIIVVKAMSAVVLSLITAAVLGAMVVLVHGVYLHFGLLLLYVCLGAGAHIMIGFMLVILSRDFNALLVNYMGFVIVFTLPVLFLATGLIPANFEFLVYLSPSYMTQILINTSIGVVPSLWLHFVAMLYLVALIVLSYKLFVAKKFKEYIIKG